MPNMFLPNFLFSSHTPFPTNRTHNLVVQAHRVTGRKDLTPWEQNLCLGTVWFVGSIWEDKSVTILGGNMYVASNTLESFSVDWLWAGISCSAWIWHFQRGTEFRIHLEMDQINFRHLPVQHSWVFRKATYFSPYKETLDLKVYGSLLKSVLVKLDTERFSLEFMCFAACCRGLNQ